MSEYFFNQTDNTYHWHKSCSNVPSNLLTDIDWTISTTKPSNFNQCKECQSKDSLCHAISG